MHNIVGKLQSTAVLNFSFSSFLGRLAEQSVVNPILFSCAYSLGSVFRIVSLP